MSISVDQKEKLERARDLLSHANPSGELAVVLERALDLLLEKLEKQRFAQNQRLPPVRKCELHANSQPRSVEPQRQADGARGESKDLLNEVSSSMEVNAPALGEEQATRNPSAIQPQQALHVQATQLQTRQRARREHISNEVLRAVARRDDFRCTYVDGEGRRCPSRAFLQVHHEHAYALGGPSTFENLRLLCSAHNRLLAERDFGRAHQELFTRRRPSSVPAQPAQVIEGETVTSRTTAP
jgi:5-methylcytosine-specific restriction endonuclease McrA